MDKFSSIVWNLTLHVSVLKPIDERLSSLRVDRSKQSAESVFYHTRGIDLNNIVISDKCIWFIGLGRLVIKPSASYKANDFTQLSRRNLHLTRFLGQLIMKSGNDAIESRRVNYWLVIGAIDLIIVTKCSNTEYYISRVIGWLRNNFNISSMTLRCFDILSPESLTVTIHGFSNFGIVLWGNTVVFFQLRLTGSVTMQIEY